MQRDEKAASDVMPVKDSVSRHVQGDDSIPLGPEVFDLPRDQAPSREQLRNIWMTFNIFSNYIGHPSLKRGRDVTLLGRWLEAILLTYPGNPYIHLFSGLCYLIQGQGDKAKTRFARCDTLVAEDEPMWSYRFERFGLDRLISPYPNSSDQVYERLETIKARYTSRFPVTYTSS